MIAFPPVLALALTLAQAASPGPAPASSPTPVVVPVPSGSPAVPPSVPPSQAPPETPAPPAATAPVAAPGPATSSPTASPYKYRFVPHLPSAAAPGQPLITAVYLNDAHLRSKGTISIKVETNAAVIKVVSRSNGREGLIPEVRPGDFEASSRLPKLPFIASGVTIELEFVATSADGRKTSVRVPVKLD